MDFNSEVRKKQLDNLDQLISASKSRIYSVLNYLGWTEENIEQGDCLVQCPVNPNHKISSKSWNEHIERCIIKIEGYDLKSQFLSESIDNPTQSIYIEHNKKIELVTKELSQKGPLRLAWNGLDPDPKTTDRLISTYSPDERLIFYNYAVANTTGPPVPPEFTTFHNQKQDEEKTPTYEEILIQERDAKRRRAKYKSVHINRKNYTEVIREVINGQMDEYKEWVLAQKRSKSAEKCNNGYDEFRQEQERPHSSISRNSNRSSSSRSTSRKFDHHREKRESSKELRHRSRGYEREYERHRHSSDERRHRCDNSIERKHSKEREKRRSSRERRRRSYDDTRRR